MEGKGPLSAKSYRSFVFDFDGTLFTIPIDWISVRREIERVLGSRLDPPPLFLQLQAMVTQHPELKAPLFSAVDSFELKAAPLAEPKPGAVGLLQSLSTRSRIALVTMQGRPVLEEVLRRCGMMNLFGARITREDSLDRTEQILMALRKIGSLPEETLFVGDLANDVICARRSKVDVAIMGRKLTGELTPDYSLSTFAELAALLTSKV